MRVIPVPCLNDNYSYIVASDASTAAAVVDPPVSEPVLAALAEAGLELTEIWLTHHHPDHVGGVAALCSHVGSIPVRGSVHDRDAARLPNQTVAHVDGDTFEFGGTEVRVLDIPGHTLGHIAFAVGDELFCGDMLFVAGCGRVFEGTMEMMQGSLGKLRALPDQTRVWCGHEYTVNNLEFAITVEPDSQAVAEALANARARRERGERTIPGTIGTEKETNPFFRYDVPAIAEGRDPVATFTALRERKDRF